MLGSRRKRNPEAVLYNLQRSTPCDLLPQAKLYVLRVPDLPKWFYCLGAKHSNQDPIEDISDFSQSREHLGRGESREEKGQEGVGTIKSKGREPYE